MKLSMRMLAGALMLTAGVAFGANPYADQKVEILGMTNDKAMEMSGVPEAKRENDDSCSNRHNRGDVSNQWCHIFFTDLAHELLIEHGQSEWVAHIGGLMVFLAKEHFDQNYDPSDVVTAPIEFQIFDEDTVIQVVFRGDGGFWLKFERNF